MSQFDGRYDYTKPWVLGKPETFEVGEQETNLSGRNPNFDAGAPLNPYDVFNTPNRWTYNGPWASNEERLTQQALVVATIPGTELQMIVRPNLPQIRLFPPRFGWGEREQPGIDDVVSIDRQYMEPRVSWFSGGPAGYTGSSRNDLGAN